MNVKNVKCIYFGVIYSMIVLCLSLKSAWCLWRYRRSGYTVSYSVAYVFFRFYRWFEILKRNLWQYGMLQGGFYKLALTDFRISFEGRVSADEGA